MSITPRHVQMPPCVIKPAFASAKLECQIYRAAKNSDFVRVVGFCAVLAGTRTDNFSSIRISLINARARSRNPDPDIRSHVRLEDQYSIAR